MSDPADAMNAADELGAAIVAQAPDAIIVADRQGVIRVWNDAARALFGHSGSAACGQSLDLIVPPALRAAHWDGFNAALNGSPVRQGRSALLTWAIHRDGTRRYVELSFAVVRDAAGDIVGAVAIARDATARHIASPPLAQSCAVPHSHDQPRETT